MNIDMRLLLRTLDAQCGAALRAAIARAMAAQHAEVGVEHLLLDLLAARTGLDTGLRGALGAALASVARAGDGEPALSEPLIALLRDAWLLASLSLDWPQVRPNAILLALVEQGGPYAAMLASIADTLRASDDATTPDALARYTCDLTAQARAGRVDPVIGRDAEIRQVIDILLRRRQNNPLLVGAPGVGKTAVVEGLARRIAEGDVPPPLLRVRLLLLDLALLQAGAGARGEFEQRLTQVLAEVRASPTPVIVFIDEAHTLIGAGGAAGQGDAANLLKPALARGELRTVAATTWPEYKKYLEKDPALARRFQLVQVEEPDGAAAIEMLRGVADGLEQHHGVDILEGALHDAVHLSQRYVPSRQLPDKAIAVLDTACAQVALGQHDTPPQVEAARRRIGALGAQLRRLCAEQATGAAHQEAIARHTGEQTALATRLAALELRWQEERTAVQEILRLRQRIRRGAAADDEEAAPDLLAARLLRLEAGLESIRQDEPMVPVCVDSAVVAGVISAWTGVPLGKMLADESHAVRNLEAQLAGRVIGQPGALKLLANRIKAYRAGLTDPHKPVGVFLLVGATGTGKTETACALADALYGGERNLVTINLSEYQEAHTVAQLKGAPPGYVGHGAGGVLTEAVRRKPYSVVLLDEFEKAHPDVLEAFYNVFDKGVMEDGTGLVVDFRNTVILATSNACAEHITGSTGSTGFALTAAARAELARVFRPALLARMAVLPYLPLSNAHMRAIVQMKLERLHARVLAADPDHPGFDAATADWVLGRCSDAGAREIDRVINDELMAPLADAILEHAV